MKLRYILIPAIVLLLIGVAAYSRLRPQMQVEIAHPRVQTIRAYVDEQAVTELPSDYLIAMEIPGWLERITLREGDPVKKDQVVAHLDVADLKDRVEQAQHQIADLETKIEKTKDNRLENNAMIHAVATVKSFDETVKAAEAKAKASGAVADFARSEVGRIEKLGQAGAAAERETRAAETEARRSEADHQSDLLQLAALRTLAAVSYILPKMIGDYIDRKSFDRQSYEQQLAQARSQLEMETRNLSRAEIRSPIDGVVLERHQTRRQYLQGGTPLLTLGRLDDMEVIAEVLTERATRLAAGNDVDVYGEAIGSTPIHGKVTRIYPAGFKKISSLGVEQQRVNVAVKLDHRPERLGVAFRVQVRIYYDQADNALVLPRTALFRSEKGNWQVMKVVGSRTELQDIQVGLMNDDETQITSGVTKEDAIVTKPSSEIVPGLRVSLHERN
jgi:HlyD family secretion protein